MDEADRPAVREARARPIAVDRDGLDGRASERFAERRRPLAFARALGHVVAVGWV
jgi:hypothetical protein